MVNSGLVSKSGPDVRGGRRLADKRRGSLPGGRARVFWAGPLCGIRAETVVCCAGMAHVDALDGSGDVDERERVGTQKRKKHNKGGGNSTPRTSKHRKIKDAYARKADWRSYHSECPEIEQYDIVCVCVCVRARACVRS